MAAQPLEPVYFDESLDPEVKVSGATRVGVLFDADGHLEPLDHLLVELPSELTPQRLCMNLTTRDGRYQARIEFDLSAVEGQSVELVYPTRFQRELVDEDQPYLAALASLKADCSDAEGVFVPVAWESAENGTEFHVLINSGHNDARIVIPAGDGTRRVFPCSRIDADKRIAFDKVCAVERSENLDYLRTEIERDDFFNPLPSIELPIAIRITGK